MDYKPDENNYFLLKKKYPCYLFQYASVGWHLFSAEKEMHISQLKMVQYTDNLRQSLSMKGL